MYELVLPFRTPFDFSKLLRFFEARAIPGVECVENDRYERLVRLGNHIGTISVCRSSSEARLEASVALPASTRKEVTRRLTSMFDLDADPTAIHRILGRSTLTKELIRRAPGIRVPGAWDPFEILVRAIVGQQVSVAAARTILGRIVARTSGEKRAPFPTPSHLVEFDVRGLGMPNRRADSVHAVARAVADGLIDLEDPVAARQELLEMSGIGPWTVEYVAMRAFGDHDAFPHGDLVLRRVATRDGTPLRAGELREIAEAWRPWRAYAAVLLWATASAT